MPHNVFNLNISLDCRSVRYRYYVPGEKEVDELQSQLNKRHVPDNNLITVNITEYNARVTKVSNVVINVQIT